MTKVQTAQELQAELELARAAEARYRLLLEHSGAVVFEVDCSSGRLEYLSPAAAAQFGYVQDMPEAQALAASLLVDLPARLARLASGDQSRRRVLRSLEIPHRDGHQVPVEIESTLVEGRLFGVVRDMSVRAQFDRDQKKFASMLNHEFRTPLSTIDGAVQHLVMKGANHDEASRKRYDKIQAAVDRLLGMMDDYLSPERMASIGRQRQPNEVSPAKLLESLAEQGRARRAGISVYTEELPQWMRCDPAGMRLALEIVLDNAIKYTNPNTAIELLGKKAIEGGIEFLVRDFGAGVPEEELARLFEKSYRGSNAAGVPGSGLGLYMARAMIDVHGGSLTAKNVSESGMEFRIWLPIASPLGKSLAPGTTSSDNSLSPSKGQD
jgi:PAS domain S-box-containing protein